MKPPRTVHAPEVVVSDDVGVAPEVVVSDDVGVASKLIACRRVGAQRPRLVGGLWFGAFGGVAAAVWFAVMFAIALGPVVHYLGWAAGFVMAVVIVAVGAFAAFVAGLLLSRRILLPKKTLTPTQAGWQGVQIAAWSNFVIGIGYAIPASFALFSRGIPPWSWLFSPIVPVLIAAAAGAVCLIVTGLVTLPCGYVGGRLLYRFSYRKPHGCRLHGFREGGAE